MCQRQTSALLVQSPALFTNVIDSFGSMYGHNNNVCMDVDEARGVCKNPSSFILCKPLWTAFNVDGGVC